MSLSSVARRDEAGGKAVATELISGKEYQYLIIVDTVTGTPVNWSTLFTSIISGAAPVTFVPTRPSIPDNVSTQVIASNAARKAGSYMVNNTSSTFYLQYGAAAVLSQGVPFDPGQVFKFDTTQEIRAIQNSGGPLSLDVFEAT